MITNTLNLPLQDLVFHVFPLDRTPLSIAVIWSSHPHRYFMLKNNRVSVPAIKAILESWGGSVFYDSYDNACQIEGYLERGGEFSWNQNSTCSSFVFAVFSDIYLFQNLTKDNFDNVEDLGVNITNHFLITYTGLVFFNNPSWSQDRNIKELFTDFYQFKKGTRKMGNASILVTHATRKGNIEVVYVIQPIRVHDHSAPVAAVGVEVELRSFRKFIFPVMGTPGTIKYLLDENGIIVVSHPRHRGGFFGAHRPALLRALHRNGVFQRIKFTECIHMCDERVDDHDHVVISGASTPRISGILHHLTRWIGVFFRLFILPGTTPPVTPTHQPNSTIKDCCKDYTQFQRNFNFTSRFSLEIQCSGCVARATVSNVRDTNLLLVLDHTPECECEGVPPIDLSKGVRSDRSEVYPDCEMQQEESEYYVSFQSCVKDPSLYSSPCNSASGPHVGIMGVVLWGFVAKVLV